MRILADEEMESMVVHRLRNYGHDVAHVARRDSLRGASDAGVCETAAEEDRTVLTHDDDFLKLPETAHDGVLFVPDSGMGSGRIADGVNEVSKHVPQGEIDGVVHVTEGWL
jgi:hypothetical protein